MDLINCVKFSRYRLGFRTILLFLWKFVTLNDPVPLHHRQIADLLHTLDRLEIVSLLAIIQFEHRHHVPSRDHQGMPGVDRVGIENANERAILKDKRVGLARRNPAKIAILLWRGITHNRNPALSKFEVAAPMRHSKGRY